MDEQKRRRSEPRVDPWGPGGRFVYDEESVKGITLVKRGEGEPIDFRTKEERERDEAKGQAGRLTRGKVP